MSSNKAREDLSAALAAEQCAVAKEGLLDGTLSLAQAGEIAETDRVQPGIATELAEVAKHESLAVLRETARDIRVRAIDPEELHQQQRAARFHRHWRDKLGKVRYSGAMMPEDGVPAMNRVDAETDRIFRAANSAGIREPREAYAADAFAAALRGAPSKPATKSADVVFVVDLNAYRRGRVEPGETSTTWAEARSRSPSSRRWNRIRESRVAYRVEPRTASEVRRVGVQGLRQPISDPR